MGLREWARAVRRDVIVLWLAARDPRTPLAAKIVAGAVAAYALSPIDLIPDFIPILGYLDDLVIVPAGIWLTVRLLPPPLLTQLRLQARETLDQPHSRAAAVAIVATWIAIAALTVCYALAICLPRVIGG